MNNIVSIILIIASFVISPSCQRDMNYTVNIKVKVLKVSFNEDIYSNGQSVAYEEIFCEDMGKGRKKIVIVNYDYNKMKTIKENQKIEIGIPKTVWNSNNNVISMNEIVYIRPLH